MSAIPAYIHIADQIKAEWLASADPQNGKKLPTQEELAERFGVSRSTIVRALSKLVAEGYLHSQQGSGVYVADTPPRETGIKRLSLIVPDLHAPVVMAACRGAERRARRLGYQVLLASSEFVIAHERELVEQHRRAGVKGIILYPVTRSRQELENDYLLRRHPEVPLVAMDIGYEEWPCSRVQFDNYRLGYDMTQQLLRHGHRRIAFLHISPDHLHSSIQDRRKGWETALDEAGREIPASYREWPAFMRDVIYRRPLHDSDYQAVAESLLTLQPLPDAVIAWNDVAAAHLIQALTNLGVRVPETIRVAGFDCEPLITRLFRPLFPTSKPDFVRLGELAVDVLDGLLADGSTCPRTYYYPVSVLWREPRPDPTPESAALEYEGAVIESALLYNSDAR